MLPQRPVKEPEEAVLLPLAGLLFPAARDRGISLRHVRDGCVLGTGERGRRLGGGDPRGDARRVLGALFKKLFSSSSMPEISLRFLGLRALSVAGVELVLELGWEEDVCVMVGWFI